MNVKHALAGLVVSLLANLTQAAVVNFNSEKIGSHFDPYIVNRVTFSDSVSNFLNIVAGEESYGGNALSTPTDDASYLNIFFPTLVNYLAFDFGNDDGRIVKQGDQAFLLLFTGLDLVSTVAMDLNGNDLADQIIIASGVEFDTAVFVYVDSNFDPLALSELIDNLTYTPVVTTVPEPGTPVILAIGILAAATSRQLARRHARRTSVTATMDS